jgi:hypothetical protein
MRIYLGGVSRPKLRTARQVAPSHVYGTTWTPTDRRLNDIPFIVDNGAYTSSFDPDEWTELLDTLATYPYKPDFVVLPDKYNDAEQTVERHREWAHEVFDRGLSAAAVVQPGMDVALQVSLADRLGADFVFIGGRNDWKRAYGAEITDAAHTRDLRVHIGNPGGENGLVWAYKIGADSVDTTTICQNGYWRYLRRLEDITQDGLSRDGRIKGRQATLTGIAD